MHAGLHLVLLAALAVSGCGDGTYPTPASGDAGTGRIRDHGARHGGVVTGGGGILIEIAASPEGRVRVWLSDDERRPLPIRDATGTVRVHLPEDVRLLTLAATGDALEARSAPFANESAIADVSIAFQGKQFDASVLLDLTGRRAGVPILPRTACVPVEPPAAGRRAPRCSVTFASTFTALGTTPDATRVIVAVTHGATSVWSLPAATLLMGLEPLPPALAYEFDPRVVAVRPDGREIAVAAGSQIVLYEGATGRLRRTLDGSGGAIHAVAWSSDGRRLLVASAGEGTARLVDAADGSVLRTLPVEGRVLAVALDPSGRWAAAGTEIGTVVVVDLAGDGAPRVLAPSLEPLAAVAFSGDRLLAAGADARLRVFDPASGRETASVDAGAPLRLLAVAPDGRHAATADAERVLRVHRLPDASVVERLDWHRATVGVLAWGAGPTLVSGDNDAALAVWDVPAAR